MAQNKYTKSARGQDCQIRIPGVCNRNPETVVFAHLNGAGIGAKHAPIHGSYSCSDCHDAVDHRTNISHDYTGNDLKRFHHEAVIRTQIIMVKEGILKL